MLFVLLLLSVTAQASQTYDYSYTFNDGAKLTGVFDGVANGNLITDLSNISVYINGNPFVGNGNLFDASLNCCWSTSGGAIVSFDGTANNFIFTDNPNPLSPDTNHLVGTTWFTQSNSSDHTFDNGPDSVNVTGTWSVVAESAVPEPGTYPILLGGLALMAYMIRRRNSS